MLLSEAIENTVKLFERLGCPAKDSDVRIVAMMPESRRVEFVKRLLHEYEEGRGNLVKKQITDKNGKKKTVWINPEMPAVPVEKAKDAAAEPTPHDQMIADLKSLSPEEIEEMKTLVKQRVKKPSTARKMLRVLWWIFNGKQI